MTGSSFVFLLVGDYKRGSDVRVLEGRETHPGSNQQSSRLLYATQARPCVQMFGGENMSAWSEKSGSFGLDLYNEKRKVLLTQCRLRNVGKERWRTAC